MDPHKTPTGGVSRRSLMKPILNPKLLELGRSHSFNLGPHEDIFKVSFNFDELKRLLHSMMHDIRMHDERFKEIDAKFDS